MFPVTYFPLKESGRHNKCGDPHVLNSERDCGGNRAYFLQAKAKGITVKHSEEKPREASVKAMKASFVRMYNVTLILNTRGSCSHY